MTNPSSKNHPNETLAPAKFSALTDAQISTMTLLTNKLDQFIHKLNKDFEVHLWVRQNGCDISVGADFCFDARLRVTESALWENQGHRALSNSFSNLEKFFNSQGLKVAQKATVSLDHISKTIKKVIESYEDGISFDEMGYVDIAFTPMKVVVPEDFSLTDEHPVGIVKTTYVLSRGGQTFHAIADSEANTFQFNQILDMQPRPSLEYLHFIHGSIKHIEHLSACGLSSEAARIFYHSGYKVHCVEVAYSDHALSRKYTAFKDYHATIAHPTTQELSQVQIVPNKHVNHPAINISRYQDVKRLNGQLLCCDKKTVDAFVKSHLHGYIFKSSQLRTSKKTQICTGMQIQKIKFELDQFPCRSVEDEQPHNGGFATKKTKVSISLAKGRMSIQVEGDNGEPDQSKQAELLKKSFLTFSERFKNKNSAELRYLMSRILNDLYYYSNLYMY